MNETLPSISIIIAARPDESEVMAANAARQLDYPDDKLEIIVARGKQPSVQRNAAMKSARGELIYFLDDDSVPPTSNLRTAAKHFSDPAVKMAGGPNLCPPDAPPVEKVFAVVLASWLAFGPSRARYTPVGAVRCTSEKELILCNMMVRRDAILELGGFDEALYPNEENALMDELQKRGGKLIYDPQLLVHRRPRHTLKAFARMLMTYGRGRAEQFRLHPTLGSALNFIPPLFCLYLVFQALLSLAPFNESTMALRFWSGLPLLFYSLAVLLQTLISMLTLGFLRSFLAMPLLVASHIFYGVGFWRGLFTKLKPPDKSSSPPVKLEIVTR